MSSLVDDHGLRSPFEHHPDLLAQLGEVITVWATLNHLLRAYLARLASISLEHADARLGRLSSERNRVAHVLAEIRRSSVVNPDGAEAHCLEQLLTLADDRNLIIHGAPLSGYRTGVFPRSEYFVDYRHTSATERYVDARNYIADHLEKLRPLGGYLFDLANGIGVIQVDDGGFAMHPD